MATVSRESANWRLFGGGGLIVGGLLWLIGQALILASVSVVPPFVVAVGLLVIALGLVLVALGETGSNGAVGASLFGKVVLVALALGWLMFTVLKVTVAIGVSPPRVLEYIAGVLVVGGGILSTFAIFDRRVARGAARWALAVPTVISVLWVIIAFGWVGGDEFGSFDAIVGLLLALAYAATGLLYLLNRRDVG
jgi:hypothetical protein